MENLSVGLGLKGTWCYEAPGMAWANHLVMWYKNYIEELNMVGQQEENVVALFGP